VVERKRKERPAPPAEKKSKLLFGKKKGKKVNSHHTFISVDAP